MWKLLIVLVTFDAHLMLLMSRIHFYSKLVTQQHIVIIGVAELTIILWLCQS
jgi:hypothetical protein